MQQSNEIKQFLDTVCEQVRWKKAHPVIRRELENHLEDQRNALIEEGNSEEKAIELAVKEMGDPVLIGTKLDCTHKPKVEWGIVILTVVTLFLGILVKSFSTYGSDSQYLTNSILYTFLGLAGLVIAYVMDFTLIGKYPRFIYFGLMALLFGLGNVVRVVNGRSLYVSFILLLLPTAFCGIIYYMRTKGYLGIMMSCLFISLYWIIEYLLSDFPSVFIYIIPCLILLTIAIVNGWFHVKKLIGLLIVYLPFLSITTLKYLSNSIYYKNQLQIAFNPTIDCRGIGYVATMVRNMISSAKFIGMGDPTENYILPVIHTDYTLTHLINQFGWVSFIIILVVLSALIIRFFILSSKQKSVLGKLVAYSVTITFTMQVIFYILSNLGLPLVSTFALPFISYSGTSTVINMILIGIILSVFKSGYLVQDFAHKKIIIRYEDKVS